MRRAAIAGLAVLALLAVLLWRSRSGHAERAAPAFRTPEVAPRTEAGAQPGSAKPEGATVADREKRIDVRGTLVGLDRQPLSEETGTLTLWVASETLEVPVRQGTWRANVPAGPRLCFERIVLGDRIAVPLRRNLEMPEDGVVEVPCRWFVPTRLRVLGEEREELRDVYLLEGNIYEFAPARARDVGPSPIVLPCDEGTRTYWVGASDHAWALITVSLGHGGERAIRLSRGGAVRVRVEDIDPEADVTLRMGELVASPIAGEALIEGLPVGPCGLVAEITSPEGWPFFSIRTVVEVEAGTTRDVALSFRDAPPSPGGVPLAGTLHVDPGWSDPGDSEASIEIHGPLAPDAAELEEDGRWFLGDLPPGRYCVVVDPWKWIDIVEVGPVGNREARLVIPAPCDVELHFVDAETGKPDAEADVVTWRVRSPRVDPEALLLTTRREEYCEEPGLCRFRAPVGTLIVGCANDLRHGADTEVALKPGLNRVELRTLPRFRFDLALRDGAMPVPADPELIRGIRVEALHGAGRLDHMNIGDPCRVHVTKAGLYRVFLPEIEGYEPVAPLDVEVAYGTIQRTEVPLRRLNR